MYVRVSWGESYILSIRIWTDNNIYFEISIISWGVGGGGGN